MSPLLRSLRRTPAESLLAVLALSLGMGLSATLFSILNAVVFSELPFPDAHRILYVGHDASELRALRERQTRLEPLAGYTTTGVNVVAADSVKRYFAAYVSASFFDVLQVKPALGTGFNPSHEREPVVMISHRMWQDDFRGDAAVVGAGIRVNGQSRTIIGVMPSGFSFPRAEDLWIPWPHSPQAAVVREGRSSDSAIIGRLRSDASPEDARAEINLIAQRNNTDAPPASVMVVEFGKRTVKGEIQHLIAAIMAASLFVLLIACANVANLNLGHAMSRLPELAVRTALGASRGQLIRHLLSRTLALSVCAALPAILICDWSLAFARWFLMKEAQVTGPPPPWIRFEIDANVAGFVILTTLLAAVASGLTPAFKAANANLEEILRDAARSTGLRIARFSRLLIHVQLAASVLLVSGAGLLGSMLLKDQASLTYQPQTVLTARLTLDDSTFPTPQKKQEFFERLTADLRMAAGVEAAAFSTAEQIERAWLASAEFQDRPALRNIDRFDLRWQVVHPDYFRVFSLPLLHGRNFRQGDQEVAIVNRQFAGRHWPGESAIGKRIRLTDTRLSGRWLEVIGVVADMGSLRAGGNAVNSFVYVPPGIMPVSTATVLVRGESDALALVGTLRSAIARQGADIPMYQVASAAQIREGESVGLQFPVILFAACGIAGLVLASTGVYGVLSLAARQRYQEIGIRMALGANRSRVLRMMMLQGSTQIAGGVIAGILLSIALGRVLASIFGAFPHEVTIYAVVAVLMTLVGLAALAGPSIAMSRTNPLDALRKN